MKHPRHRTPGSPLRTNLLWMLVAGVVGAAAGLGVRLVLSLFAGSGHP